MLAILIHQVPPRNTDVCSIVHSIVDALLLFIFISSSLTCLGILTLTFFFFFFLGFSIVCSTTCSCFFFLLFKQDKGLGCFCFLFLNFFSFSGPKVLILRSLITSFWESLTENLKQETVIFFKNNDDTCKYLVQGQMEKKNPTNGKAYNLYREQLYYFY